MNLNVIGLHRLPLASSVLPLSVCYPSDRKKGTHRMGGDCNKVGVRLAALTI